MSRQPIRELKRQLSAGVRPAADSGQQQLARDAALALLERSIGFGHARLAVIRLSMAVHVGAEVPVSHWTYCEQAAQQSRDQHLLALWRDAAQTEMQRCAPGVNLVAH